MNTTLQASFDRLRPLGRWLFEHSQQSLWELDTRTLPMFLRRKRRLYRRFAQQHIAPLALTVDANPEESDLSPLFVEAGRRGFLSELLPWPLGRMPYRLLLGAKTFALALKAEEFCAACGGIGLALLAHDLGMGPLMLSGHLPSMLRWQWPINWSNLRGKPKIMAYAITEPEAGSDVEESRGAAVAHYGTTARKEPGGYVINGRKVFISGGARADYISVFAVLEREDGSPPQVDADFTCFIVEKIRPGFKTGRREHKLGQRAADATELIFQDVHLPPSNLVGSERSGWALNRNVLNYSRAPVGAIALGIARGAVDAATQFCRQARLKDRSLIEFQEIQLSLAEMWMEVMAMRGLVWQAARYKLPHQGVAASAKTFCADTAFRIANQAMQLMGDHGYLRDQRAEKALRDARLNQIYEGTNQINALAFIEAFWEAEFHPVV